jgi:hypothetical protein
MTRRILPRALAAAATLAALVGALTAFAGSGVAAQGSAAAAQYSPTNSAAPTISGTAQVDQTLTAANGTWNSQTTPTFSYQWQRCDNLGNACAAIAGSTQQTYKVTTTDVGKTIRVVVTATNPDGAATATSSQTAVVTAGGTPPPSTSGCPNDKATSPINVSEVTSPAHLLIDKQAITPSPVGKSTRTVVFRFHVSACGGRSIVGALVYQTPTPYQQFSASEVATGPDGWATITAHRLRFFPASSRQQLLVVFVRARKSGEDLLGGISARRLVSFKVNLNS